MVMAVVQQLVIRKHLFLFYSCEYSLPSGARRNQGPVVKKICRQEDREFLSSELFSSRKAAVEL